MMLEDPEGWAEAVNDFVSAVVSAEVKDTLRTAPVLSCSASTLDDNCPQ